MGSHEADYGLGPADPARRQFLALLGRYGLYGVGIIGGSVMLSVLARDVIDPTGSLTRDQKRARQWFDNLHQDLYLRNLTVDEEVNIRDRPVAPVGRGIDTAGGIAGYRVGRLKAGTVIEKAIVVWGNDPEPVMESSAYKIGKAPWLAFPNPGKPGQIVFAYGAYFRAGQAGPEIYQVAPIDLSQKLPSQASGAKTR